MTNVDVACIAAELAPLLNGGRVEKAYQPAKDQILLRMRRKGVGKLELLFELGRFLTITRRSPDNPDKPSMVANILRSELGNGRIVGVSQVGFDRLLRIDMERGSGPRALVFELFGDGNLLLLGDNDEILLPMRGADHGARKLRKGEIYAPPPGSASPFALGFDAFVAAGKAGVKDTVRFLAVDLGFGPQWAKELCVRSGVKKNAAVADLPDDQWKSLHDAVADLGHAIARNDLAPLVMYKGPERIDAVPFPLETYPEPEHAAEEAATFRDALDAFFVGTSDEDDASDDPRQKRFNEAKGKLDRRIAQMEQSIAGFEADEAVKKTFGDVLYLRYQEVDGLLRTVQEAHNTRSWQDIEATLKAAANQGNAAAAMLNALNHDATAVLDLSDLEGNTFQVPVDVRRNVQDNAEALYAAGKKARSRTEGARVALEESRAQLAALEAKGLDGFGAAPTRSKGQSKHFWFETYRWTVTPSGFLCVGGRNAGQNDAVVKKYLRDGDRYVHAAIHGAPSIVVRPADGSNDTPDDEDLLIAGQFAVCASRAWRQFGEASAYWVTANQVNKTPRSGEFVPRGAWIVHGKRNLMDRLPMDWAVGLVKFTKGGVPSVDGEVEKLMGGPPASFVGFTDDLVRLVPGDVEPNDAASALAERFGRDMEEAQHVLPGGPVRLEGL